MRGTQVYRILVLSVLLASLSASATWAREDQPGERLILALYDADINWATWALPHCDQPVNLYVSADESVVERHVREARLAGIDALISAWYGPSYVDNPTAPNIEILLDRAFAAGLGVAVMVDITAGLLPTSDAVADAIEIVRDDHAHSEAYLVVDGRPVVFFLGQQALSTPSWEAVRGRVDPDRQMIWIAEGGTTEILSVFDGLYLYEPDEADPPGALMTHWGSLVRVWNQIHGTSRYWVATVMPGYDDSCLVGDDRAFVRPRNNGETYRDSWAAADTSDPDWFVIRSYNEWGYCTHIERSLQYGDFYAELTDELSAQYRIREPAPITPTATELPPSPTPVEPSAPLTPTATLTPVPSPTSLVTPTATLTATATPFRLSTPTTTPHAVEPAPPDVTPSADETVRSGVPTVPWVATTTTTPMPHIPVEGESPPQCAVIPLLVTVVIWGGTRSRRRGDIKNT